MKLNLMKRRERGDTLVEVLLALAIVSAVAVGAVALMTRAMNTALGAMERSQVRSGLVEQAELLQYIRDSYARADNKNQYPASLWTAIKAKNVSSPQSEPCNPGPRPFFINNDNLSAVSLANYEFSGQPATYAKPGEGIWVEAQFVESSSVNYVDFYIKACWSPVGSGAQQQAATVVRLYDSE
jgi:prepilin-type N-terminal cleavage/methylation domain-containing protein